MHDGSPDSSTGASPEHTLPVLIFVLLRLDSTERRRRRRSPIISPRAEHHEKADPFADDDERGIPWAARLAFMTGNKYS